MIMPRRGKRHYSEIWAEEDGHPLVDGGQHGDEHPSSNQGRGSLEQINDENAQTDQVSVPAMLGRLLGAMRVGARPFTDDRDRSNGIPADSTDTPTNGALNSESATTDPAADDRNSSLPPATLVPDFNALSWKTPSIPLDHAQAEERIKAELRHIGFLGPDAEPDYDAHNDDEVAERLRLLQAELKETSIINGARKARMLELATEQMAHQEYSTIHDDLDTQVEQVYLKRTRTLSKGKKNAKRPGGGGGGSHFASGSGGTAGGFGTGREAGVTKPGIGDVARQVMERRAQWANNIGPIFDDHVKRVRGPGESVFTDDVMEKHYKAERDRFEEEQEEAE
jgi:transcriptional adapter 3